ncbi:MAG: glycosyltransferase family 2 protein [Bryobacterales bacterium]|nr:glycosyltransferase family 2 protein [Bryobacterales bacterium]
MLSVVIPALNEEAGIAGIVEKVLAAEDAVKRVGVSRLEVIVVDDGSRDATAQKVEQSDRVRLIRHETNRGYGAAIKTGFGRARGDLLAFLDADSTYPPEFLATLCEALLREDADVVVGSRRAGSDSKMPPVRRLGNLIWSSLLTLLGSEKVQDPASGMRVVRRRALQQLYPLPNGLNFTPVMSTRSLHEGLKVIEIPISYRERSGRSKLSVVRDGLRFLWTILWTALQYNPARILELIGFAALIGSGLIGALLVAARLSGITTLGALGVFAVYSSLVLAVGGVSMFSLAIVFNRLVTLFHRRPIRQPNLLASIMGPSPERYFPWAGILFGTTGVILGGITLALGLNGWELQRLWLWLLGSALFTLVGVQLLLFWTLIRVLDTLLERDARATEDLLGQVPGQPPLAARSAGPAWANPA